MRKLAIKLDLFDDKKPVFSFMSGKFLTKAKLNSVLAEILGDFTDTRHKITGYSFRAAIPSALASHPNASNSAIVKEWGGWVSSSFELYTKNEREKRRHLFKIVTECLFCD